jgi:hypothetical protein
VGGLGAHLVHGDDVTEAHPQVLAYYFVHFNLAHFTASGQHYAHGVLALIAFDAQNVAAEYLQLVQIRLVERHHTIVVVFGFSCSWEVPGRGE